MEKCLFSFCVVIALFLVASCASLQIGQSQLQSYTFNYSGKDYSVLLPKEVPLPDDEQGETGVQCFYWAGPLCVAHVRYIVGEAFSTVSFWFTKEKGILALVYHVREDGKPRHVPYLYVKGLPVPVSGKAIQKKLDEWNKYSSKESI